MKLTINNLNHEGDGVGTLNGKVVFVAQTLPNEQVKIKIVQQKKRFDRAEALEIERAAPERVTPACPVYHQCGGCSWQHIDSTQQIKFKAQIWLNQLQRLGRVQPEQILPALEAEHWHYRSRARLFWDGQALGFRQRHSHEVVSARDCLILPPEISAAIAPLEALLRREAMPILGVDVSRGEALVLWRIRAAKRFNPEPYRAWLAAVTAQTGVLQAALLQSPSEAFRLPEDAPSLHYRLHDFDLTYVYQPDDFTQVHQNLNAQLVQAAMEALEVQAGDKILDAFCGLGNFTLAMARLGADVLAVEGVPAMAEKIHQQALRHGLRVQSACHDLFKIPAKTVRSWRDYRKWLIDPPRAGAEHLLKQIKEALPERIVYVSCDAGTLARDAAILTQLGYRYRSGRVLNMFPQTAHLESLNVFTYLDPS